MIEFVDIQITNKCNRKCLWCPPYRDSVIHRFNNIDIETVGKIVDIMNMYSYKFSNNLLIKIGRFGEPTLEPKLLFDVAFYIRKNLNIPYRFQLNTNGDTLEDVQDCVYELFDDVYVSRYVDLEDKKKSLSRLLNRFNKSIKRFYFSDVKQQVNIIIGNRPTLIKYRYQYHKVMSCTTRGGKLKFTDQGVNFIHTDIRASECDILGKFMMFDWNGDIYPCCELSSHYKDQEVMCCGNINRTSFEKIWTNIKDKRCGSMCKTCNASIECFR